MLTSISGKEIYYAARGESGAPLLFIHGAGDSHLLWNGQLAAFAPAHRTISLDLPGHGRSAGPARSTIADYAAVVREFMDALALPPTIVVGSSMGGAISQALALDFPDRVRGLVLVGTGARLRVAPAFVDGIQTDFATTANALVEHYYAPAASPLLRQKSFAQLAAAGADVLTHDFYACDHFDVRERLYQIQSPTLVLCGEQDKMTPPTYSEYLAQQIPHSQFVLIPNAGHMVMLEQPAAFNRALGSWLTTL